MVIFKKHIFFRKKRFVEVLSMLGVSAAMSPGAEAGESARLNEILGPNPLNIGRRPNPGSR
jgi:hypothetical protein